MVEDVVGEREFVGGSGDGDEVREAEEGDQNQHGLSRLPVLLPNPINFIMHYGSVLYFCHYSRNCLVRRRMGH